MGLRAGTQTPVDGDAAACCPCTMVGELVAPDTSDISPLPLPSIDEMKRMRDEHPGWLPGWDVQGVCFLFEVPNKDLLAMEPVVIDGSFIGWRPIDADTR